MPSRAQVCNSGDRPASSGTDTAVLQLQHVHMPAGDAIRPFLLHAYGGLYMDVDVECFDATDDMVDGFDLVSVRGQPKQCCHVTVCTCHQATAPTALLGLLTGGLPVMPLPSCMRKPSRRQRMKPRMCSAVSTGASAGG